MASRPDLGALAGLGDPGRHLIDLQRRSQRASYLATHAQAEDHVVELPDATPVARCWTAQDTEALHLLDLAVHPGHRRRGIATATLAVLVDRSSRLAVPLRLHVWHENRAARTLYADTGFRETGAHGGHVAMERPPDPRRGGA